MVSRMSRVITRCWTLFCTSTTGEAPVTVMVSFTVPTPSTALTDAVNEVVSSIPSCLTVLKPKAERDGVHAWPQVNDFVLTLFVGDNGSHSFDEGWARGFDSDAWQHRAGRVLDDACDASRLCRNDRG